MKITTGLLFIGVLVVLFFVFNGCQPTKNVLKDEEAAQAETYIPLPDYAIENELIVQLESNGDIETVVKAFASYDMSMKKMINKRMRMYVLTFDAKKVIPQAAQQEVQQHEMVKTVEFNKKVETRN